MIITDDGFRIFEEGDRVVVNMMKARQYGTFQGGWDKKDILIGEVEEVVKNEIRVKSSTRENSIENWESEYGSGLFPVEFVWFLGCRNCDTELIYHDSKETHYCPFCEKTYNEWDIINPHKEERYADGS